jgi:TIR domain/SIR2-like domain
MSLDHTAGSVQNSDAEASHISQPIERAMELARRVFWDRFLGHVARRKVVPIVGDELLLLPDRNGNLEKLSVLLAGRFIESTGIQISEPLDGRSLGRSLGRHSDFLKNRWQLYSLVNQVYKDWSPPIPKSLLQLAEIVHFNVFLSTTGDDLLERAINEVRFGGEPVTQLFAYSPNDIPRNEDLDAAFRSERPVVFKFFGSFEDPDQVALTDADIVEFVHALQSPERRPVRLFDELRNRDLLLLGNSFPDWLARFFLRITRDDALLNSQRRVIQYISDSYVLNDPYLSFFIRNFTTSTEVAELPPADFVGELYRQWKEKFPNEHQGPQEPPLSSLEKQVSDPFVFISYASEDAAVAFRIHDELEARRIPVWMDKERLLVGDRYEKVIRRRIFKCGLFVPLISKNTDRRTEGFFRKEWGWAEDRMLGFRGSDRPFLMPVIIDQTNFLAAKIPESFETTHYTKLVDGVLNSTFVQAVKQKLEKLQ